MKYDVVIIGAGPGGIFSAYELMKLKTGTEGCCIGSRTASGEEKMSD